MSLRILARIGTRPVGTMSLTGGALRVGGTATFKRYVREAFDNGAALLWDPDLGVINEPRRDVEAHVLAVAGWVVGRYTGARLEVRRA